MNFFIIYDRVQKSSQFSSTKCFKNIIFGNILRSWSGLELFSMFHTYANTHTFAYPSYDSRSGRRLSSADLPVHLKHSN